MRRAVGVLWCVAALAGCGGDDTGISTSTTSPPQTTTEATSSLPGTTEAGPTVVPIEVAPCDLVTADEVAAAVGLPVEAGSDEPPISCRFDLVDGDGVHVAVIIEDGQGRLGGAAAIFDGYRDLVAGGEAEEVPGLGDAALYAPGFRGLAVDAGAGRFVVFAVGGGYQALQEPEDALIRIAEAALSRL
jgi:hypothetical protein